MNTSDRINELMARAENLGLQLKFDSGLLTVSRTTNAELDRQRAIVVELGKYMHDVRHVLERRAVFARTNQLLGETVWSPEFGDGKVEGANSDVGLTISIQREGSGRRATYTVSADSVIIIREGEAGGVSSEFDDQPKADKPRGFFGQLLRRGEGN